MSGCLSNLKHLKVVSDDPVNAEIPLRAMSGGVTPNDLFFMRNRFALPDLDPDAWRLTIGGAVRHPCEVRLDELRSLEPRSVVVTLECAGNGRAAFSPPAEGEPWGYGAVGTASWTGVSLASVLRRASLAPDAIEVLAEGADSGPVEPLGEPVPFARSLPLDKALHPDTLLAYAMNGDALPPAHGGPVRLIVPCWYGMASVKWVTRIEALTRPFEGFFQRERYVIPREHSIEPLTRVRVRSIITAPLDQDTLSPGIVAITGLAWSGETPVETVDVSTDGGTAWARATWTDPVTPYAWRAWVFPWGARPGRHVLQSRATDASGNEQPMVAEWNRLGYANNAIQCVRVEVRSEECTDLQEARRAL